MKAFKHMTAFVLALVIAAAYAASVTVKYRVYVYSDEITFRQYDYSQSTTPSITNLTISATSGLGSGSVPGLLLQLAVRAVVGGVVGITIKEAMKN